MRRLILICCALFVATSAFADLSKEESKRLSEAGAILNELRNSPDKGIPEDLWNKSECIVVIPSIKKAAFAVGGEYGSGVMSCRTGTGHESATQWSAPVFMQLMKGSVGFQIGGESIDLVLLIMNRRGLDKLLEDKVSLGADASVAAGPVGRTAEAATDAQLHAEMLSYSRSEGVFAGIDLSGGVLRPDKGALAHAYGPNVTARDVVMGTRKVAKLDAAVPFMTALKQDVRATTGKKK
jgi:lipid-binding SYLF domain-containing protein